jgi:hypothetical protein
MPVEIPPKIVIDIINDELSRSEFADIIVNPEDYVVAQIGNEWYIQRDDPFRDFATEILDRVSTNHFKSSKPFYHFKSADRIVDVLRHKRMLAANLPAHHANDNLEFRAWIVDVLGREEWLLPESEPWHNVYGPLRIDDWRGGIHILCFTNNVTNWMWANYAGTTKEPSTGACLEIVFENFNDDEIWKLQPLYDFRDVIYDNESEDRFAIFSRIETRVFEATGKKILFHSMVHFAWCYKRYQYRDENEARLSFDTKRVTQFGRHMRNHYDMLYYDRATPPWGSIELPLLDATDDTLHYRSPHFEMVLRKVILGCNILPEHEREIRRLIQRNYLTTVSEKQSDSNPLP